MYVKYYKNKRPERAEESCWLRLESVSVVIYLYVKYYENTIRDHSYATDASYENTASDNPVACPKFKTSSAQWSLGSMFPATIIF